ncbi:MAG: hypothetical protein QGD94_11000, partial [Planctomycetia bacterium]|nr:hypothetical protein [Planctomycetia bacterium]
MTRKWRKGLLLAVALMLISAQADSAPRIKYLKPGKDSLADDQVSTIVFDKSNVWIGTYRGLSLYNKRSGKWRTFRQKQGLPHRHVTALALDGGVIWVGTRYGLVRMDKKTFKTKSVILDIPTPTLQTRQVREVAKKGQLIDQYILSIAVDGDQLWVGTGNGAALYDKKTGKSKEVRYWGDLFHDDYLDIKVETSKVWVAANRAFAIYDKNTRDWTVHATSLSDKTWRNLMGGNDLAVDKDYVWIATHAGVARYDKGARQLGMYTVKGG